MIEDRVFPCKVPNPKTISMFGFFSGKRYWNKLLIDAKLKLTPSLFSLQPTKEPASDSPPFINLHRDQVQKVILQPFSSVLLIRLGLIWALKYGLLFGAGIIIVLLLRTGQIPFNLTNFSMMFVFVFGGTFIMGVLWLLLPNMLEVKGAMTEISLLLTDERIFTLAIEIKDEEELIHFFKATQIDVAERFNEPTQSNFFTPIKLKWSALIAGILLIVIGFLSASKVFPNPSYQQAWLFFLLFGNVVILYAGLSK